MGVLQYQLAQQARASSANRRNEFIQSQLPSPYLQRFDSFRSWRRNVDRRLWEWKESAPKKEDTGVQFSPEFLELNYWQAVIMLYRQSLSVPAPLARELSPADDVSSPSLVNVDDCDDEQEVFLKVAEAGQRVLRIYRQLHRVHLVNYTYLATHHLFMAGISFLYAIWHSPLVRSRLTLDDVDFTVLAATSVLGDLMDKCPPAEACRDAFKRMSKATVQMCLSTTGFGSQASTSLSQSHAQPHAHRSPQDHHSSSTSDGGPGLNPSSNVYPSTSTRANTNSSSSAGVSTAEPSRRPAPRFDMNLRDLFPEDVLEFSVGRHNTKNSSQDNNTRDPAAAPESDATPAIYSHPHRLTSPPFDGTSSPQLGVIDPTLQSAAAGTAQQSQSFPPAPPQPPPNFSDFDFSTMDFLDSHNSHTHQPGAPFVGGGGGGIGIGVDGYGHGGGLTAVGGTSTGLDLGFGMAGFGDGVGDHDWSEGMSMDIFDGFYFGGGGGGGSGSGWNGN
ncbi:MAG: Fungal specific transcription factor [Sclerophora amabilis]|nr:MAG: Fungal specific transcription factor [Sclerophora amabilis]